MAASKCRSSAAVTKVGIESGNGASRHEPRVVRLAPMKGLRYHPSAIIDEDQRPISADKNSLMAGHITI